MTYTVENKTLADLLEIAFSRYSDRPAFSALGQTLSFSDIEEKSRSLAYWLQNESGLETGDRVAIQLPNIAQYPIVVYAILRAGMVVVNTNPMYTDREIKHQLTDSGTKAIFIFQPVLPVFNKVKDQTSIERVIEVGATDLLTGHTELSIEGNQSFTDLVGIYADKSLSKRSPISETIVLQYTGGTTGVSKGAELTNLNLVTHAEQVIDRFSNTCKPGHEIFIAPLPLYHVYAFSVNPIVFALQGNLSVLIPDPRDLDAFVKAIKPYKFTTFSGINTLLVGLSNHSGFRSLDFSNLKLTISGGATLTTSAAEQWYKLTGCTVSEGYGLSETSAALCLNVPGQEEIGTVGLPLKDTIIDIRSEAGESLPDGQEGEVVAKAPQVMKGYWNRPEETQKVMTEDGFFRTGDIGKRMPSGTIKIVDRLKDLIIVSGFNVYPNEVEDVLTQHPGIVEAAVVSEPDERAGEKVCAYITAAQELNEEAIIEHCREHLTSYKIPKKLVVMDELPKSTVGKILRRELRTGM